MEENFAGMGIIWTLLTAPDSEPTSECRDLLHRMHDTRSWSTFWPAADAIAYNLALAGRTEQAARIAGYLDSHGSHTPIVVQQRDQTLELVRHHDQADEWTTQGAAMNRDEMVTYIFDQIPGRRLETRTRLD